MFPAAGFFFLAGLHRSGTSIVHRLLRAHPDGKRLFRYGRKGGRRAVPAERVFPSRESSAVPAASPFDARARLDETSDLCTDENRDRLGREWSAHLDAESPVLIEKSPPNITKSRFLQAMFSESLVHLHCQAPGPRVAGDEKMVQNHRCGTAAPLVRRSPGHAVGPFAAAPGAGHTL